MHSQAEPQNSITFSCKRRNLLLDANILLCVLISKETSFRDVWRHHAKRSHAQGLDTQPKLKPANA